MPKARVLMNADFTEWLEYEPVVGRMRTATQDEKAFFLNDVGTRFTAHFRRLYQPKRFTGAWGESLQHRVLGGFTSSTGKFQGATRGKSAREPQLEITLAARGTGGGRGVGSASRLSIYWKVIEKGARGQGTFEQDQFGPIGVGGPMFRRLARWGEIKLGSIRLGRAAAIKIAREGIAPDPILSTLILMDGAFQPVGLTSHGRQIVEEELGEVAGRLESIFFKSRSATGVRRRGSGGRFVTTGFLAPET